MSQALDMSLDDIIRNNKKSGGSNGNFRGRGRGRGFVSGPGPARRFPNRAPTRTTPYLIPQMVQVQQMLAMGGSGSESATKLYVSNLDYGVSNEDLKGCSAIEKKSICNRSFVITQRIDSVRSVWMDRDVRFPWESWEIKLLLSLGKRFLLEQVLFSEVGEVKRHSIHYDRSGRSKGTAEVVFTRQSDALTAVERYNNVQLDGKPMKIELVGVNIVTPPAPPTTNWHIRKSKCGKKGLQVGDGTVEVVAGGGRGFGRGRGRGRGHGEKVSAEALDADLEKYHIEAMQIN
ncbi:unnamed protein product [Camellia sinensis]